MRVTVILFLFAAFPAITVGQDTSFVNKHTFPSPVRNVLAVENEIYVKTGDGLYKLDGSSWERQRMKFDKSYVFYEKGWVESDYLPERYSFNADKMAHLVPQRSVSNASRAEVDDRLYVSVGGSLFEYAINKHYRHSYGERSIRDIYLEDGLKVVCTYSGIIINDTLQVSEPYYANGFLRKIGGRYFLSSDHLYEFIPPSTFVNIPSGINLFAGYSRKLVEFQNTIYSLNTKSLNRFDSLRELQPVHQGFEYYDLEVVGDRLLFCTQTGEVFSYDGKNVSQLLKLDSRIRDLYYFKNTVYVSSDNGLYTFNGKDSATLTQLTPMPFTVMTVVDPQRNTWIATENGLYVLPDRKKEPILFIRDVEFNRGSLTVYGDDIYAGSISGLYSFNSYDVVKDFLPLYFNKKKTDETEQRRRIALYGLALGVLGVAAASAYRVYRKRKARLSIPHKEPAKALTLSQIADDIKVQGIMTVEGLAEYYQTNTVQLNRQFKSFGTTPGRFMKQVKLEYAREMLQNKTPIDEVAAKIGYSAIFIRKELQLMGQTQI